MKRIEKRKEEVDRSRVVNSKKYRIKGKWSDDYKKGREWEWEVIEVEDISVFNLDDKGWERKRNK